MKPTLPIVLVVALAATNAQAQHHDPVSHSHGGATPPPHIPRHGHHGAAANGGTEAGAAPDEGEAPTASAADSDTLIQAIQSAAVASNAEGARSISMLILRGVAPRVAAAGLDALGVMARAEGSEAVARFMQHRRPLLRRHAIAAAQAIHSPPLVHALADELGDEDGDARVDAATALAEVGNHGVVPQLFGAFERDLDSSQEPDGGRLVHESARAIARIGSQEDVQRLMGFLRRAPFRTMADSMRIALERHDLTEPFKVHVVEAVGDLATHEVKEFLESVIADTHGQENAVTRAAHAAADRIAE